jgi:diguanylate cyclase (GGDEF)-like protein
VATAAYVVGFVLGWGGLELRTKVTYALYLPLTFGPMLLAWRVSRRGALPAATRRAWWCLGVGLAGQINDAYGHGAGDTVLREVAGRCRTLLRTSDLLGRYGGDELVALLPETHAQGAAQLADRIRDAVTGEPVRAGDALLALTLSLGVADSDGCEDLDGLLHRADVALYQAKRRGRDQAATWSAGGRGSRARG